MRTVEPQLIPLTGQLHESLSLGLVPASLRDWGQRLLFRLQNPVQVVLIGPKRCGKSTLLDMLLGQEVLGKAPSAGLVEITFGPICRHDVETADGARHRSEGLLSEATDITQPTRDSPLARLHQELPDVRLRDMTLTEVTLSGSAGRQAAIVQQAVAYADILLWCSTGVELHDQTLWSHVPDAKKDHSFLVLTMADHHIMRGTLDTALHELGSIAAEDFLGLYPVAALQGLRAQLSLADANGADTEAQEINNTKPQIEPDDPQIKIPVHGIDRQLWQASGGKRLYDDLMHQIALGRTSDMDQAEVLLRQYAPDVLCPRTPVKPGPKTQNTPIHHPDAPPSASHHPDAPPPARITEDQLLTQASEQICAGARRLLQEIENSEGNGDGLDLNCVFESALLTVRNLCNHLENRTISGSEHLEAARAAAQDGEELLMLCQLEQNEDAAIDAVTLLLQLKREVSPPP